MECPRNAERSILLPLLRPQKAQQAGANLLSSVPRSGFGTEAKHNHCRMHSRGRRRSLARRVPCTSREGSSRGEGAGGAHRLGRMREVLGARTEDTLSPASPTSARAQGSTLTPPRATPETKCCRPGAGAGSPDILAHATPARYNQILWIGKGKERILRCSLARMKQRKEYAHGESTE